MMTDLIQILLVAAWSYVTSSLFKKMQDFLTIQGAGTCYRHWKWSGERDMTELIDNQEKQIHTETQTIINSRVWSMSIVPG